MSSGTPDPSQPDQFEQRVRQIVYAVLNDPLGYPDAMTNWLTTFVSLNSTNPPTAGGTPPVLPR